MKNRWSMFLAFALMMSVVSATAQLNTREGEQQGQYGQYGSNYIAEGTRFVILLDDKLETKKLKPGKKFEAKLAEDLVAPNGEFIPRGKKIRGHVSSVEGGMSSRLLLSFDSIETKKGRVPLAATVVDIPNERGAKIEGDEGEIKRGSSNKRVLGTAAGGAAIGAAAGAVKGGVHGALVGAAVGGAAGAAAGLLTGRDMTLDKGTQLEIRLDRPLLVPMR